jgi:ferric-dicitrate binding protein FerR (iron transport regulator)
MNDRAVEELMARLLAGDSLTAAEQESVRAAFAKEDATAAADQVLLDRLLRHHFINTGRESFTAEVLARISPAEAEASLRGKVVRRLAWRRWRFPAVAAAVAMIAGVLWLMLRPGAAEATLIAGTGAQWSGGAERTAGAALHTGDRLLLESGFVSLRFASGTEVVLEGLADLEITGRNSATLHRGSAVARVPANAQGFSIASAQGRVVDLGTEFAVKADAAGMEVHVLEGSVEAYPARSEMVSLGKDQAARLNAAGAAAITAAPDHFLTALPPDRAAAPMWLHWSFDEGRGTTVAAAGTGLPLEPARGTLTSLPGSSNLPSWTAGVRGAAVEFHGRDDYIQTAYPGISGPGSRTVACWVRVPQDFSHEGFALVSWGAHQESGDTWQLSINPYASAGPVGRLRIGTHNGHVIGVRDLRDGQWHHVAAVLYGGRDPDVSTHVLLYVDGELEPAATKTVRRVRTDTGSLMAQPVAFGKNSGVREAGQSIRAPHTFRGCMDEVTLCASALSQADIRIIMARGMAFLP